MFAFDFDPERLAEVRAAPDAVWLVLGFWLFCLGWFLLLILVAVVSYVC